VFWWLIASYVVFVLYRIFLDDLMHFFTLKALRLTIGSAVIAAVGFSWVTSVRVTSMCFTYHWRRRLRKFFPSTCRQTSHEINMIVIARQSSARENENTTFGRYLSDCLYCDDCCPALHPLTRPASKNSIGLDLTNEAVTIACYIARSQNCEERLLVSSCVSVRTPVRLETWL
jgi:hypothetical protein